MGSITKRKKPMLAKELNAAEIMRIEAEEYKKRRRERLSGTTKSGKTRHIVNSRQSAVIGRRNARKSGIRQGACGTILDRVLEPSEYDKFTKCKRCYPSG